MQEMIRSQQVRLARRCDRLRQHACPAVDILGPSSRQTRKESSTVVCRGRELPVIGDDAAIGSQNTFGRGT